MKYTIVDEYGSKREIETQPGDKQLIIDLQPKDWKDFIIDIERVNDAQEDNSGWDNYQYETANYHINFQKMEMTARRQPLIRQMQRWRDINDPEELNRIFDGEKGHVYVYYNISKQCLEYLYHFSHFNIEKIYFSSASKAQEFIDSDLGKEYLDLCKEVIHNGSLR